MVLDDGRSLGLMIRGGAEYALGIYITGVDQGSAAECGGLKVSLMSCLTHTHYLTQTVSLDQTHEICDTKSVI